MMFVTGWKVGAVVLLASYTIAGLTTLQAAPPQRPAEQGAVVPSEDRLFVPDQTLMYVNFYSTTPEVDQDELRIFAYFFACDFQRMEGVCRARSLGDRISVMRILLNPERMRANKLSSDEVREAVRPSSLFTPGDWLGEIMWKVFKWKEHELIQVVRDNKPEQFGEIILRATPQGVVLRLKEVAKVEIFSKLFDVSSDVDGHPAVTIVAKLSPGSNAAEVIASVKEKLKHLKRVGKDAESDWDSWPAETEFEVIPFENQSLIYAVIEAPRGAAPDYTSGKCRELRAISKDIHGIRSVTSLLGYEIRNESGDSNAATCLLHLKAQSARELTSSQIIEKLVEKCRTKNIHIEFFEPPAVLAFVTKGGFTVRVMSKTKFSNNERPGEMSEAFMDELLNRKELANLFTVLASHRWPYELVIDNDVAMQRNVSIAKALENLAKVVGDKVRIKQRFADLVDELSDCSVKNDRGDMVPYRSFMRLRNKLGLNEIDH